MYVQSVHQLNSLMFVNMSSFHPPDEFNMLNHQGADCHGIDASLMICNLCERSASGVHMKPSEAWSHSGVKTF